MGYTFNPTRIHFDGNGSFKQAHRKNKTTGIFFAQQDSTHARQRSSAQSNSITAMQKRVWLNPKRTTQGRSNRLDF
jgi:hypothetical protein